MNKGKGKMTRKMRAGASMFDKINFFGKKETKNACDYFIKSIYRDYIPKRKIAVKKNYNLLIDDIQKILREEDKIFANEKDRLIIYNSEVGYFKTKNYDLKKLIKYINYFNNKLNIELNEKVINLTHYAIEEEILNSKLAELKNSDVCADLPEKLRVIATNNDKKLIEKINYDIQKSTIKNLPGIKYFKSDASTEKYVPKIKTEARKKFLGIFGGADDERLPKYEEIVKILEKSGDKTNNLSAKSINEYIKSLSEITEILKEQNEQLVKSKEQLADLKNINRPLPLPPLKPLESSNPIVTEEYTVDSGPYKTPAWIEDPIEEHQNILNSTVTPESKNKTTTIPSISPTNDNLNSTSPSGPPPESEVGTASSTTTSTPQLSVSELFKKRAQSNLDNGMQNRIILKKAVNPLKTNPQTTSMTDSLANAVNARRGFIADDSDDKKEDDDNEWIEGGGKKRRRHSKKHPKKSNKKSHKK